MLRTPPLHRWRVREPPSLRDHFAIGLHLPRPAGPALADTLGTLDLPVPLHLSAANHLLDAYCGGSPYRMRAWEKEGLRQQVSTYTFFFAQTRVCLVSTRSDGPGQAESPSTTYLSRVIYRSHAACSGRTYIVGVRLWGGGGRRGGCHDHPRFFFVQRDRSSICESPSESLSIAASCVGPTPTTRLPDRTGQGRGAVWRLAPTAVARASRGRLLSGVCPEYVNYRVGNVFPGPPPCPMCIALTTLDARVPEPHCTERVSDFSHLIAGSAECNRCTVIQGFGDPTIWGCPPSPLAHSASTRKVIRMQDGSSRAPLPVL